MSAQRTRRAYIRGLEFWASRLPGWDVAAPILRGERGAADVAATRPTFDLLAPTERRRAPDTVAIALAVASRACQMARVDPKATPSVFASTCGDLSISDYMNSTLASTPTLVSPIRFHNSVHNAAAGYWSIGTGSHAPYTAITAYSDTFGEGMLEALVQAHHEGVPVLLSAYDIEARGPAATIVPSRGIIGAGLVLATQPGARHVASLEWRTITGSDRTPPLQRNLALVGQHAMATSLPVFELLAERRPGVVRLGLSPNLLLEIEFDFPRRSD